MQKSTCPACGASIPPDIRQCPYCDQWLRPDPSPAAAPAGGSAAAPRAQEQAQTRRGSLVFRRAQEPKEGAFTFLVPEGWLIEGGISRANPMAGMINAASIEAKLDIVVKREADALVALRIWPEVKHCDLSMTPAGMMGFFPPGSSYQGMIVSPAMAATEFLLHEVFPLAHPTASDVEVVSQEPMPLLCQRYRQKMAALGLPADFDSDGGTVTFQYTERGRRFVERAYTVIENLGPMAAGMWSNKDTVLMRAPEGELDLWETVLIHIVESVQISREWLNREARSQGALAGAFLQAQQASNARDRAFSRAQQASQARDRGFLDVQREAQEIDQEIADHRMMTNAEIQNDEYLTLMGLEEYENPYTNEVEVGSNEWEHRWVNGSGEVVYTDEETFDPNIKGALNRTDWVRSPIRKRSPE